MSRRSRDPGGSRGSGDDQPDPGQWRPRPGTLFAHELLSEFTPARGGVAARFTAPQAALIRDLVGQVAELVGAGRQAGDRAEGLEAAFELSDSVTVPDDPVLARLLPDGYRDDPAAAGEFRRYTEQGLRSVKEQAARTVLATLPAAGGLVRLDESAAQAWLRALNDVRLALGVRLQITDEEAAARLEHVAAGDAQAAAAWVYQGLTYLQQSLVEALG